MTAAWYTDYFTADWWALAEHEYTAQRTAAEVAYLAKVLKRWAPGPRVVDLGCGTGRHAVGLAQQGFDLVGLDVSDWALAQAQARAQQAGVTATWHRLDALTAASWPVGEVDAVICVQSFGWGSDTQQVRLLYTVRRHLRTQGVLVLDHSSATAILRHHVPVAEFAAPDVQARFVRSYRPLSGRSVGHVELTRPDGETTRLHDDVRLYQPHEVAALLARCGYEVICVDADFTVGAEVTPDTRYVQFVARPTARLPAAIDVYRRPDRKANADSEANRDTEAAADAAGEPEPLDLRWSPDEVEYVRAAIDRAWQRVGTDATSGLADAARHYAVADPFGGVRAAPVVADHFGCVLTPDLVTVGAGATSLLHGLAAFALPGPVLYAPGGHADLPRWVTELGAAALPAPGSSVDDIRRGLSAHRPTMLVLDRPSLDGELFDVSTVADLARAADEVGAVVVLDEAYATYAGPQASAAPLVTRHPNLVVVRSMSKGYCCGGLRMGFALAAPPVTQRLREVLAPLLVSEVSRAVGLALLAEGDVFGPLRARIAEVKPRFVAALAAAGLRVRAGAPFLPWVLTNGDEAARRLLRQRKVLAKLLDGPDGEACLRLAVPLSADRLAACHHAFPEATEP